MTKDELIEMAFKAGVEDSNEYNHLVCTKVELVAFAKLVAEKEREGCADIAEKQRYAMNISLTSHPAQNGTAVGILNQIRARGNKYD